MIVGFTGTSEGMTDAQLRQVRRVLLSLLKAPGRPEFHHGDCVGADAQAAAIARELGYYIIAHPPTNSYKRAFFKSDEELPAKAFLVRNRDIVAAAEVMIATPFEEVEQLRSGTWATVRYTRQAKKKLYLIPPNFAEAQLHV